MVEIEEVSHTIEEAAILQAKRARVTKWKANLTTPDGRRSRVRTVWQVDDGEIAPRLITAYPLEQV